MSMDADLEFIAQAMPALQALVREHLIVLLDEVTPMPEKQLRRDTWSLYEQKKQSWQEATRKAWQAGLSLAEKRPVASSLPDHLELVSTETVENRMQASRMALSLMEVAAGEVNDLRKRLKHLESVQELSAQDIVHPEVLLQAMVEQWTACGLSLESWALISEVVQRHINTLWRQSYANCNAELVAQGVLPNPGRWPLPMCHRWRHSLPILQKHMRRLRPRAGPRKGLRLAGLRRTSRQIGHPSRVTPRPGRRSRVLPCPPGLMRARWVFLTG